MIDDYESAMELVEKMRSSFPILVKPTARSRQQFIEKGHDVSASDMFEVDHVDYAGDDGGIMCMIKPDNAKTVFGMSLTHLEIDPNHPLYEEMEEYRQKRIIRLAMADGKLGQAKRLAKKQRKSKKKGFGN